MKQFVGLAAAAAFIIGTAGTVQAQFYVRAFTSSTSEIPAPNAGVGDPEVNSNVNHMVVIPDVDTDGDGNAEIVVFRADAGVASAGDDKYSIYVFEVDGTDNGYTLKFSDNYTLADGGNFNEMGHMVIADLDNADGDEIIMIPSPRFGAGAPAANVVIYASSGDDVWGAGNTATDNEFSMSFFLGVAGASDGDSGTDTENQGADVGDFDGDGILELALVSDRSNDTLVGSVTSGTFVGNDAVLALEADLDEAIGGSPYAVEAADMNDDGQMDIIQGYYNNIGMGGYYESPTTPSLYIEAFDLSPGIAPGDQLPKPSGLVAYDFDSVAPNTAYILDARTGDIARANGVTTGNPFTDMETAGLSFFATGSVAFGAVDAGTDSDGNLLVGQSLSIGDHDGDTAEELIVAITPDNSVDLSSKLYIYEYSGSGDAADPANFTLIDGGTIGLTADETIFDAATSNDTGAALDLDGDGLYEVVAVTAGATEPALIVFEEAPAGVMDWHLLD